MGSPAHPSRGEVRVRDLKFLGALHRGAIALDGAMGTALWTRVSDRECLEALALTRPELVAAVHEEHLAAGARAIETNTFGANRVRLEKHGLADRVREINEAAVAIARRASAGRAFVLGAMGPTSTVADARTRDALAEQAASLVAAGVDALVLETFYRADDVELALEAARSEAGPTPIVALVTVDANLEMFDKTSLVSIARRLATSADVVGVNCCDGPETALAAVEVLSAIDVARGSPSGRRAAIAAMPSAGLPRREDGVLVFDRTPEDFAAFARRARALGARLVGGCCGTTAAHVRAVAEALGEGATQGAEVSSS
jgi:methionine synthase / methylenetetrahydrofolate reductase(NADPH)